MITVFQKFEKNNFFFKKIAKAGVIKQLITIPLTLETMQQLIIKLIATDNITSRNYAVTLNQTLGEVLWLLRLGKPKKPKSCRKNCKHLL